MDIFMACELFWVVERKLLKSEEIKTKRMLTIHLHNLYLCFSNIS